MGVDNVQVEKINLQRYKQAHNVSNQDCMPSLRLGLSQCIASAKSILNLAIPLWIHG
jgi:hypothetical protein